MSTHVTITSGSINTSQVKVYIWTALLLCMFCMSQVKANDVIFPGELPVRRIPSNQGQVGLVFQNQLAGVQTPRQPQRTVIPSLAKCGRSPASFDRKYTVQTIKPGDFPWLAAVGHLKNQQSVNGRIIRRRQFKATCAGTLITHRHVLSAAHCFFSPALIGNQPTHVRLGVHDLRKDGDGSQDFRIVDKRTNNFNQVTDANDIILLKLKRHVKFNGQVSPACLPIGIHEENYYQRHLTVVGWGMTTKSAHNSFTPMREEPVHVPLRECWHNYQRHSSNHQITGNNICAGRGDADACMGDSGGPLNFRSSTGSFAGRVFVVGIVSFGPFVCGSSNLPGAYTSVANYLKWIINNLN